jgi:hypothetical protein
LIYNLDHDPNQEHSINDEQLEGELTEKLTVLLQQADAPDCQFERLAISRCAEPSVAPRRGKPREPLHEA